MHAIPTAAGAMHTNELAPQQSVRLIHGERGDAICHSHRRHCCFNPQRSRHRHVSLGGEEIDFIRGGSERLIPAQSFAVVVEALFVFAGPKMIHTPLVHSHG